ncbi:MAG: MFS transporter, partial [Tissierellales bacterium]|nr:MFS transporter [Tissierellales bacterium]
IGMDEYLGYQLGFVITALWWGLFTIPMLKTVEQNYYIEPEPNPVKKSFKRLYKTFKNIRQHKIVFIFLIAYFFYIDGVGTIIKMAVPYSQSVLGGDSFDMFVLLGILLIVQVIAFPFAIIYGNLAKRFTAKKMIMVAIITYLLVCVYAFTINSISQVFVLGALIGSAQGGIQALSRSYYAKIIPKVNSNEFFGFYNIFGKFAAILGPFIMAFTTDVTGSARNSILALMPMFFIGLIILIKLPDDTSNVDKHAVK